MQFWPDILGGNSNFFLEGGGEIPPPPKKKKSSLDKSLLVYSAELLTDFSYTNFTVSYRDALDRLRVHLNFILLSIRLRMQYGK